MPALPSLPPISLPPYALLIAIPTLFVLILFLLIRWWIKKTAAALLFTLSLILNLSILVPVILGIIIFQEAADLQQNFMTSPKLILMEDGGKLLLGMEIGDIGKLEGGSPPFTLISQEKLQAMEGKLQNNAYQSILDGYYKIFIVKWAIIEKLVKTRQGPAGIPGEIIAEVLRSPKPLDILTQNQAPGILAAGLPVKPEELKAMLLLSLVQGLDLDPLFLIGEFRQGNIFIYPDSTISNLAKLAFSFVPVEEPPAKGIPTPAR